MHLLHAESKTMGITIDDQPCLAGITALIILFVLPFVYLPPGRYFNSTTFYPHYLKLTLFQTAAAMLWFSMMFRGGIAEALRRARAVVLPAALLLGWSGLTLTWSPWRWAGAHPFAVQLSYVAGAIGLMYVFASAQARRVFVVLLGISAAAAAVTISAVYYHGQATGTEHWFFPNKNLAGGFLVMPAAMAAAFLFRRSVGWGQRVLLLVMLCLCIVGMFATECRGAVIGLAAGAALMAAVRFRRARWPIIAAAFIVCAVMTGMLVSKPAIMNKYLGIRPLIWRGSLATALDRPVTGHGLGSYFIVQVPNQVREYYSHPHAAMTTHHAHCQPLEIWIELGTVGLTLFGCMIAALLRTAFTLGSGSGDVRESNGGSSFDRTLALGAGGGIVAMVAHALVSVGPSYPDVQINFWIASAMLGGLLIAREKESLPRGESRWTAGWRGYAWGMVILIAWWCLSIPGVQSQYQLAAGNRILKSAKSKDELVEARKLFQKAGNRILCEPIAGLAARAKIAGILAEFGSIDVRYIPVAIEQLKAINIRAPHFGRTDHQLAELHIRLAVIRQHQARLRQSGKLTEGPAPEEYLQESLRNLRAASDYFEQYCKLRPAGADVFRAWLNSIKLLPLKERAEILATVTGYLDAAVSAMPDKPLLRVQFARALKGLGDTARAEVILSEGAELCEQAIKKRKPGETALDSEQLYEALLTMDLLSGKPGSRLGQAVALLEADMASEKKNFSPRMAFLLAEYYHRVGRKDDMRGILLDVARVCQRQLASKNDIETMELLARTYQRINPLMAGTVCHELLKRQRGNPTANDILRELAGRLRVLKKPPERSQPGTAVKPPAQGGV